MSDPVTNVEIEDVLSSIRRLVADDARPKAAAREQGKPERLVLTPAQRVPDDLSDPAPAPGRAAASRASATEPRPHSAPASEPKAELRDSAAVPFRPSRKARPLETKPESAAAKPDAEPRQEARTGPAAAARRLTLGLTASDDEFEEIYEDAGDEPSFDASTLLGKLVEEELARAFSQPSQEASRAAPEPEPEPEALTPEPAVEDDDTAELLSRIAEIAEPAPESAPEPDQPVADLSELDDGIPTADVPLPEPELPEMRPPLAEAEPDTGLAGKIAALEAMIARHKAESEPAPEVAEAETEAEIEAAADPVADDSADAAQAAFVHRPQKPLEWQDHKPEEIEQPRRTQPEALVLEGPVWKGSEPVSGGTAEATHLPEATDDGDALPAPVDLFDEEMLRDLVSEIIRQELQGALGERITRNVRKMVRREIHRMVTSEHFD